MTTYAALSIASNSPGSPTGYGVQGLLLAERLKRDGYDVAALSNFGLEGNISTLETKHGPIAHYPRGYTLYSGDVLETHHKHFLAGREIPNAILTLYDAWVYLDVPALEELKFWSWTPVDHLSVPPKVAAWAKRPNVKTIAMSPFGQRQFEAIGVDSTYIPHAVDTSVYKPTDNIQGYSLKQYMGVGEDDFIVGMVSANKANGSLHRKAYAEAFLSFAMFRQKHPNAYLYVHAEPSRVFGGFHLATLMKAVGLPQDAVLFPDPHKLRYGYSSEEMAGLYSAMDVLLHASYGEGFGVPAIEAQAAGTRVIGSNWAATPELLGEDSWLVDGQPFWDEAQSTFFQIPLIPSLVTALEQAYAAPRGVSTASVEFSKQFEVETVYEQYWKPFLAENL
jgi:glycosyltransferase involved in cell wall biosynthesis